jgi:hypothetical protein
MQELSLVCLFKIKQENNECEWRSGRTMAFSAGFATRFRSTRSWRKKQFDCIMISRKTSARGGWSIRWKHGMTFRELACCLRRSSPAPRAAAEVDEIFGIANEYALRSMERLARSPCRLLCLPRWTWAARWAPLSRVTTYKSLIEVCVVAASKTIQLIRPSAVWRCGGLSASCPFSVPAITTPVCISVGSRIPTVDCRSKIADAKPLGGK